ncbi:hypothetical protein HYC85_024189 [Camellia sinensis]|uniref:K Homology domain-containing protein n=1 Tax=Camellia sinensis TaxID=4442 RepID=A0A7J7G7D5_CAMSI|nr:hypothetical protein HYC85_024189 [Camellia sinensis]
MELKQHFCTNMVLISGKEELESPLSPAIDAVIRVFKRVNGLPESEGDRKALQSSQYRKAPVPPFGFSQVGESLKAFKAVEAVVGHLRKFLVDQSVLPLFEKSVSPVTLKVYEVIDYGIGNLLLFCLFLQYNTPASQERQVETWAEKSLLYSTSQIGMGADYPLAVKRDPLFHDRETHFESNIHSSGISLYGQDPGLSGMCSSGLGRAGGSFVTQIAQTMQIPLSYAEDIIGIEGENIAYIRRTSGAILSVQESRGLPDEIIIEALGEKEEFLRGGRFPSLIPRDRIDLDLCFDLDVPRTM